MAGSLTRDAAPLGVLRIPASPSAPVPKGTNDWALNRGIGHIPDTAAPGAETRVSRVIATEFFRAL